MSLILENLNEVQQSAVLQEKGPVMIIAGAGSGKTRVLTYRIAHLIQQGVEPFRILALTFTNKAAREMRERIEQIVGTEARNLWMGTFHSVFAKILRFEAEKIGYQSNFTIYDTDDVKSLLKNIVKELGLNDKLYKPNVLYSKISNAKNNLITWQLYGENLDLRLEDENSGRPRFAEIYKIYSQRCFQANAMDFDDLLLNTNKLLDNHLDVLNKYQYKFEYILIDEFQDTNLVQYSITKKLASLHQNICVVGDDAQSIYAFRGANIQNILNFERDYDDLKIFKLEQNYRSTDNIVQAANSLIKHNKAQLPKKVWTSNDSGYKVSVLKSNTDAEEGRLIAESVFEERLANGLKNNDFAILYRTNAQSRAIEESLRRKGIPYRIIGGLSFYQRKEIKDMLAYFRFATNINDVEAFRRIINYPKRGIGATTVEKIIVYSYENEMPLWDILENISSMMRPGKILTAILDFVQFIKSCRIQIEEKDAYDAASFIAKHSGLLRELYDDKTVEGRVRYENLQELLNGIKAFVDNPEVEEKSLSTFLQEISLLTSSDQEKVEDAVTLMTIHMSKGLEFQNVYIAGLEENLFPSQMMLESRADLEEERRLFYVAITRAKRRLFLHYALQRYRFGKLLICEPSRFLNELDPVYLELGDRKNIVQKSTATSNSNYVNSLKNFGKAKSSKPTSTLQIRKSKPSTNFKSSPVECLKEGQRVEHIKFGFGEILNIEKFGNDKRAKVNFEEFGDKTLILSFAKLKVAE